jgi:hypothetical protein
MMVYRRLSERQAEQARAALEGDWMTLVEGAEFVKRTDANIKQPPSPYEQIFDAVEDGELRGRWEDESFPPRGGFGSSILWVPNNPNSLGLYKRKFRLENGGEIHWGGRRWRKLLLSRKDMQRLFGDAGTNNGVKQEPRQLSYNDPGKEILREAISAIYGLAEEQEVKPPNLREIAKPVQQWLEKHKGVTAPGSWIEEQATDSRYKPRRGKPGARVRGLRPVSDLQI